jgi:hypothetical protein
MKTLPSFTRGLNTSKKFAKHVLVESGEQVFLDFSLPTQHSDHMPSELQEQKLLIPVKVIQTV